MPVQALNDRDYLKKQYKDSSNLDARIRLHQRFGVNKYGWQLWVFDQLDLPDQGRVLELGCGPGRLWEENLHRIPPGSEIILSDYSAGMLEEARRKLEKQGLFQFKVIDAQSIPCENGYFDAVIANHMLYHVPDRPAALAEIRRVLKPTGHFYASTVGERHLIEIRDLKKKFNPALAALGRVTDPFTLENGMAQLLTQFSKVKLFPYENALDVTEVAPLVDYIQSGWALIPEENLAAFREFVAREMKSHGGAIHITLVSGLFASIPKGE
jgi:ubiquinone/menaquinone biosynthesis C-methylase UbiE